MNGGREGAETATATGTMPRRANRRLSVLLRLLASGALLWFLLRQVSLADIRPMLGTLLERWPLLLVAVVLPGLGVVVGALRWRTLLEARGERRSVTELGAAILVGAFFNQFLPSTIGGDVARALWIDRTRVVGPSSRLVSLAVVALDRFVGVAGMAAAAVLAAAVSPASMVPLPEVWVLAGVICAFAIMLAVLTVHPAVVSLGRRLFSAGPLTLRERVRTVHQALSAYRNRKWALAVAFLLSLVLQGLIVLQHVALAAALGTPAAVWGLCVVVPMVTLIAMAPITINGIGLRENALAVLAAPLGFRVQDAIVVAWLVVAIAALYGAGGGLVYLLGGRRVVAPPHR